MALLALTQDDAGARAPSTHVRDRWGAYRTQTRRQATPDALKRDAGTAEGFLGQVFL